MICYGYAFEVSPTLKNICSYLYDLEGSKVDLYLDRMHRDKQFSMPGVNVIDVSSCDLLSSILRPFVNSDRKVHFTRFVGKRMSRYSRVIAVDFNSLSIVNDMGCDMSNVVYVSLESTDYISFYPKELARSLLSGCALCVVQSRERSQDINDYLGTSIPFAYLPVSCRPITIPRNPGSERVRIIYSGYIAEWACLTEFVEAFRGSLSHEIASLVIQGHSMGTDGYLAKVSREVNITRNAAVDNEYYGDDSYFRMLAKHDVGLAFYKNIHGTANFENMILSSGKIASYLWNGLAVLTNIDSEMTRTSPFVFIEPSDRLNLRASLESIGSRSEEYSAAARDLAKAKYDFDSYMDVLYERFKETAA